VGDALYSVAHQRYIARRLAELSASPPVQVGPPRPPVPPPAAFHVRNDSGMQIPPWAIMAVCTPGLITLDSGEEVYAVTQPGSELADRYFVNGDDPIDSDALGSAQLGPRFRMLYDSASATPAWNEAWGVAVNSWKLAKGGPRLSIVDGVFDASSERLGGSFDGVLQTLLVKTTADIADLTASGTSAASAHQIFVGVQGAEANGGWTTVPAAYNRTGATIASGTWCLLHRVDNGWELVPLAPSASGVSIKTGTLGADLATGAGTATISGVSGCTSAANDMAYAGHSGDKVYVASNGAGGWALLSVQHHEIVVAKTVDFDGTTESYTPTTIVGMSGGDGSTVNLWEGTTECPE
jgi:hypothetical protein